VIKQAFVLDERTDAPAAVWYVIYLFHKKICTLCKFFCEKDRESSALPAATCSAKSVTA